MKPFKQLKKWPLILAFAALFAVSTFSATVLANNQTLTVKASVLNVRLGPGLSYHVMGQVQDGAKLTVISKKNAWYEVRLAGNQIGWVASWLVDQNAANPAKAQVAQATTIANVRAHPLSSAKILGTLNPGDSVNVIYTEGNWRQITYNNTAAWVSSKLLKLTGETKALSAPKQTAFSKSSQAASTLSVTATISANVRNAAGINAGVVAHVNKGEKLTVLKQSDDWYYVETASGKRGYIASWTVSMPGTKAKKAATRLSEATIVLDPGHGGTDTGALSSSGKYEKTYTLKIAKAVGAALQAKGANVIYTRSTDTFVDLAPRPVVAEKAHADAFISFHFDSSPNANEATGYTSYYYGGKDKPLAKALNASFAKNISLPNRGAAFGDFEVLRDNAQPAVLLEMGYINSNKDFKFIQSPAYQAQVASDVVRGLDSYFAAGHHQ